MDSGSIDAGSIPVWDVFLCNNLVLLLNIHFIDRNTIYLLTIYIILYIIKKNEKVNIMSQQINVNIRMDKKVKEQADELFNELGFNFTTAINTFVKQSLRERAIPFYIKANNDRIDREALRTAFQNAQEQSVINGTDIITMEKIDDIIAEVRREKRR